MDRIAKRLAFETSLDVAKEHIAEGQYAAAFLALERAHVLGQPRVWDHLRSHWWMLVCGLGARDGREVLGQIVRLVLSIPGSALGRYPRGNTGRARVDMFRPMPIAPDLERLLTERPRAHRASRAFRRSSGGSLDRATTSA